MKNLGRIDWIAIGMIVLLAGLYAWTMMDVPFHPDESTQIFMSQDLSSLFLRPRELAWDGELPLANEERIRAIDAPLAKYFIGAVRGIFSIPALKSDWDWSQSWQENSAQGALPSRQQLVFARAGLTAALPFCLWFFYRALKAIFPGITSLTGTLLLGLNPLLLLHGRRAMSEALLLLGICLFLWMATREKRNPWLIGLVLGLAIGAKHSAVGLLPAGILAAAFVPELGQNLKKAAGNLLKFSLILVTSLLLLNPFYWSRPLDALQAGLEARFQLAEEQREDYLGSEGGAATTLSGLILNLYYTEPQTEEVGNYLAFTRADKQDYLSVGLHTWGRDRFSGSILFTFSLAGLILVGRNYSNRTLREKENILILVLATLGMGTFSALLIPWQRYAVAVLPFVICWIAAGFEPFLLALKKLSTGKGSNPTP